LDGSFFIFALRKEPNFPACETLLFDKLNEIRVYMPLQIFLELQRNLMASEMRRVVRALTMAQAVTWDYAPAQIDPPFRTTHVSLSNFWVPIQSLCKGGDYATLVPP
jgi:hypothetical protein